MAEPDFPPPPAALPPPDSPSLPSETRPRRRGLGVAVALLLIAALAGGAYYLVQRAKAPAAAGASGPGGGFGGTGGRSGGPPGGGVTVGVAAARQGELPVIIDALGTVTPPVTATLVPQVSGTLTEVLFAEGQQVKKGQVLARIDARPYEQALMSARGQRLRDQAQLDAARVTLQRYQTLWKQDSIARQTVDTQDALVKQLQGTVAADLASEKAARLNVDFSVIRAPIDGLIGLRAVDPGNLVNNGSTIATITQMMPMDVEFSVPQDRVQAVRAAQRDGRLPVTALDRGRSQTLAQGSFLTLDNQVNITTGTVRAKARFPNTDGALFPQQFVNARLQLGVQSGVLVPVTAVRTGPQGDYVYVIDDQRAARMRAVTRGLASVDQILIEKGLQAGEQVVTEGGDRVQDGGRVQLAGDGPRSGASMPGSASNRSSAIGGRALSAPDSGASAPAWLERLPPEERAKVLAMPPEERRAYLQKLRAQRRMEEGR